MMLIDGFEPSTSILPRWRSTSDLYQPMARGIGIEPIMTESKSVVIPFN